MFSLDLTSRTPIYEQLYNNVVRLVALGILKENDKLPPVRSLAGELSVNPNTVAKAYKLLENDGYIFSAVGKGSFIAPNLSTLEAEKNEAKKQLEREVRRAISLGVTKDEMKKLIDEA